jgi:hypothetical protein
MARRGKMVTHGLVAKELLFAGAEVDATCRKFEHVFL